MKKSIWFPNTAIDSEQGSFEEGRSCDRIVTDFRNWENALVNWFLVYKDDKLIAEIKESVCNIFYK